MALNFNAIETSDNISQMYVYHVHKQDFMEIMENIMNTKKSNDFPFTFSPVITDTVNELHYEFYKGCRVIIRFFENMSVEIILDFFRAHDDEFIYGMSDKVLSLTNLIFHGIKRISKKFNVKRVVYKYYGQNGYDLSVSPYLTVNVLKILEFDGYYSIQSDRALTMTFRNARTVNYLVYKGVKFHTHKSAYELNLLTKLSAYKFVENLSENYIYLKHK